MQNRLRAALSSILSEECLSGRSVDTDRMVLDNPSPTPIEALLKKSGLSELSNEIRLLASRISKVVIFHDKVYHQYYQTILT